MSRESITSSVEFDVDAARDDDRIPPEYRISEEETIEEHRTLGQRLYEGLLTDKKAMFGAFVVIFFVFTAVFAPYLAPVEPDKTLGMTKAPNTYSEADIDEDGEIERVWHVLGTDSFGHDMLSRIIFGARVSLLVVLGTVLVSFTLGTTIGIVAGYYGGWVDNLLMRYVDFQWAFPELILAVGIIAFAGGRGVFNVIFAIGLAYIDDFARLIRGEVLSIREEEYVKAAEAVGMSNNRIMLREILPNAFAPLIVQTTIMIPLAILAEAALSFLGLGVQPTTPTWGILVNQGRQFINQAPWISVMPGLAIMFTVLGFNMFGDALRDVFDIDEEEIDNR